MILRNNTRQHDIGRWWLWILAVLLLVSSGVAYRLLAVRLQVVVDDPITLPVPLSVFPAEIGGWTGKDTPIPTTRERVAGNDDFLSRLYINKASNQWVNMYVPYTAHPRTMLGHRPQTCYPANGWVHDSTEHTKVVSTSGRHVPCLLHRFHRPAPYYDEKVVLNLYILNGQITDDESGFSGVGWRTPNIAGNPARYVAQVQISSVLENAVREATEDMIELILDFFPDKNGEVRATKHLNITSGVLK